MSLSTRFPNYKADRRALNSLDPCPAAHSGQVAAKAQNMEADHFRRRPAQSCAVSSHHWTQGADGETAGRPGSAVAVVEAA